MAVEEENLNKETVNKRSKKGAGGRIRAAFCPGSQGSALEVQGDANTVRTVAE